MEDQPKRIGRLARWLAVLALVLGAFPGAAGAACPDFPTSQVFAAWGDTGEYFLATGGDFESTRTSWTGGSLMAGNDPFYLAGRGDDQSLRVADGATVTSPVFCADVRHPDFRFVARPLNPYDAGELDVFVRFRDKAGVIRTWQMATFGGIRYWTASERVRLMRDLPLPSSGETTAQVLFRADGSDWAVDDVFIDPYRK